MKILTRLCYPNGVKPSQELEKKEREIGDLKQILTKGIVQEAVAAAKMEQLLQK